MCVLVYILECFSYIIPYRWGMSDGWVDGVYSTIYMRTSSSSNIVIIALLFNVLNVNHYFKVCFEHYMLIIFIHTCLFIYKNCLVFVLCTYMHVHIVKLDFRQACLNSFNTALNLSFKYKTFAWLRH